MSILENRTLGKSGIKVSPMGLGCWAIGGLFKMGGMSDGYGPVDDEESIRAINKAIDMGITFFDTADAYGTGHSERILEKAFAGIRNKVVIATKFGHTYDESIRELVGEDSSPEYIMKACEASLRRLQTDYIDLYQLHRWSIPIEEIDSVIETLDKLVEKGWIRSYGWSTDWYEGAKVFIEKSNCTAIQQGMNVFGYEPRVFELCEQNDLGCICRGPLAMGLLSGKYNHDSKLPIDDVRGNPHTWNPFFKDAKPNPEYLDKLEAIKEILRSNGRTLVQGALAYIWGKSYRTIPIPGFKTVKQVEENVGAMEFGPLTPEQIKEIESLI